MDAVYVPNALTKNIIENVVNFCNMDACKFSVLNSNNQLPIFDGFDSDGRSTGRKCMVCVHQFEECKYQSPFGEGAFLICKRYPKCLEVGCEIENM